jgi:FKBP-type peptidyl-prolyl cis-trans isomerase
MSYKNLIFLGAGIVVGAAGMWAVPQLACKAQAPSPKPEPKLDEAAAKLPENDAAAFRAMGTMCAEKTRLAVGFNEAQIGWLAEGFQKALRGVPAAPSFREDLGRAEKIYREYAEKASEARKAVADENDKAAQAYIDALPDKADLQKTASGLYYKIETPGNPNKKPAKTDRIKLNYTGSLISGKVFDSNKTGKLNMPLTSFVKGFQEGLQLIGVGGEIKLYIPGKLGYRENPPPESGIEPGAMLIFDVELLGTEAMPAKGTMPKTRNKPSMPPPAMPPQGFKAPSSMPPMTTPPPLPPELLKKHPILPSNAIDIAVPNAAAPSGNEVNSAETARPEAPATPTASEAKPDTTATAPAAPATQQEAKPASDASSTGK